MKLPSIPRQEEKEKEKSSFKKLKLEPEEDGMKISAEPELVSGDYKEKVETDTGSEKIESNKTLI